MRDFFEDARNADSLIVAQELCGAKLTKIAANEYAGPCPSCAGHDRFSVNSRKRVFNCRHCGAKGSNVDLVVLSTGCAPIEAAERINGKPRPNHSRDETDPEERAERLAKNAKQADRSDSNEKRNSSGRTRPRERARRSDRQDPRSGSRPR